MSETIWTSEPPNDSGMYWVHEPGYQDQTRPFDAKFDGTHWLDPDETRSVLPIPSAEELAQLRASLAAEKERADGTEKDRDAWAKQAIAYQCRFQQAERAAEGARALVERAFREGCSAGYSIASARLPAGQYNHEWSISRSKAALSAPAPGATKETEND